MKKRHFFELFFSLFTLAMLVWISVPRFLDAQKMAPIWSRKALIRHIAENLLRQPNPLQYLIDASNYSTSTVNKHIYLLNIYSRTLSSLEVNDIFQESPYSLGKTEKENYKIWIDMVEKAGLSDVVSDTNLWNQSTNLNIVYFRVYTWIDDQKLVLSSPTPPLGLPLPNPLLNTNLMGFPPAVQFGKLFDPSNGVTSGGLLKVDSVDLGWSLPPELEKELTYWSKP